MAVNGSNNKLGGYVLHTPGSNQGIVVANQDQRDDVWDNAHYYINISTYHDEAGNQFKDWRLPTRAELSLIYEHRAAIGGFSDNFYWSSTEEGVYEAWGRNFGNGTEESKDKNKATYKMRAVRNL